MNPRILGVYREVEFSPGKVEADAAIIDAVLAELRNYGADTAAIGAAEFCSGHVADAPPERPEIADDVAPEDTGAAPVRYQQRRQDAKQRRLAGAVGTDESEQLGCADLERDAAERGDCAELLFEALCSDRSVRRCHRPAPAANWTSTGMPIFSAPSPFGVRILIA